MTQVYVSDEPEKKPGIREALSMKFLADSTKFLNKLRRLANGLIRVVDFVERRYEFVGKIRPRR